MNPKQSDREGSTGELLTVIVPCLNEEHTVGITLEEIYAAAPDLPVEVRVMMIDDGSTDGTADRMLELCEQYPGARRVVNEKNLGLGRSVLNAYKIITPGSWVTVLPGDAELVFASIKNHLEIRENHDLILGYLQNAVIRTFVRRTASTLFTTISNQLYGFSFRYINGLKLYRVEVFRDIEVVSCGHAMNGELISKAVLRNPGLRIGEAPFMARGRAHGSSKAFRPGSILRAVRETIAGFRSVGKYRDEIIKTTGAGGH